MKEKKKIPLGIFIAGFLWGVAFTFFCGVILLRHTIISEFRSKENFQKTIVDLTHNIKQQKGWMVKQAGCSLPKTKDGTKIITLKLCNLKYANELLSDDSSKKIATMIPCSFAVYEKKDGNTYISKINLDIMGLILGGELGKILYTKIADDQKKMIENIIE